MARSSHKWGRMLAFSVWLYGLLLHMYPKTFRRGYGERMVRVFSDSCRVALQQRGVWSLIPLWMHTCSDLALTASMEQWQVFKEKGRLMALSASTRNFPLRLRVALVATVIAFVVSLIASINLYLLEDANPLTQAAYSASPLLRFSYDGIYISALAAGVAVCAIVGYAIVPRPLFVVTGLIGLALLVAFGGFGGLLVRYPLNFLVFLLVFLALTLISLLAGRAVAARALNFLAQRSAAILGACIGVGSLLLINVVVLVLHTLMLNMVSHELYMQGQIGGTHLNFSLIAMIVAFFMLIVCMVSLRLVFT